MTQENIIKNPPTAICLHMKFKCQKARKPIFFKTNSAEKTSSSAPIVYCCCVRGSGIRNAFEVGEKENSAAHFSHQEIKDVD